MRYILKDKFAYTSSSVNSAAMKTQPSQSVLFDDVKFCLDVKTDGLTVTDNYDKSFRFYHLFGTHPGAVIGAEGQHKPGVSQVEATRGCLYLIEQYIAQMKAEGVFENSTIIITADHGFIYKREIGRDWDQNQLSISRIWCLGRAPVAWRTTWPSFITTRVGMDMTPN